AGIDRMGVTAAQILCERVAIRSVFNTTVDHRTAATNFAVHELHDGAALPLVEMAPPRPGPSPNSRPTVHRWRFPEQRLDLRRVNVRDVEHTTGRPDCEPFG